MPDQSNPISQILTGYGIPGYEMTPFLGGGSWSGVHFDPSWAGARGGMAVPGGSPQAPGATRPPPFTAPPPAAPTTPPGRPPSDPLDGAPPVYSQQSMTKELAPGAGFQIPQAVPYATSPYNQGYGGTPAPFANIHDQMGAAMNTVQPAYPTFRWAPGWAEMMGYAAPGPGGQTQVPADRNPPLSPGQYPSNRPAPTGSPPPGMGAPSAPANSAPSATPGANQAMVKSGSSPDMYGRMVDLFSQYYDAGDMGKAAAVYNTPYQQTRFLNDIAGKYFDGNTQAAQSWYNSEFYGNSADVGGSQQFNYNPYSGDLVSRAGQVVSGDFNSGMPRPDYSNYQAVQDFNRQARRSMPRERVRKRDLGI